MPNNWNNIDFSEGLERECYLIDGISIENLQRYAGSVIPNYNIGVASVHGALKQLISSTLDECEDLIDINSYNIHCFLNTRSNHALLFDSSSTIADDDTTWLLEPLRFDDYLKMLCSWWHLGPFKDDGIEFIDYALQIFRSVFAERSRLAMVKYNSYPDRVLEYFRD